MGLSSSKNLHMFSGLLSGNIMTEDLLIGAKSYLAHGGWEAEQRNSTREKQDRDHI